MRQLTDLRKSSDCGQARPPKAVFVVGITHGRTPTTADENERTIPSGWLSGQVDERWRIFTYPLRQRPAYGGLEGMPRYFPGRNLQRAFVMLRSPQDDEASDLR